MLHEALQWRDALAAAKEAARDDDDSALEGLHHTESLLSDHAHELERTKGSEAAHAFYRIASGQHTPSNLYLSEWEAQADLEPKTKEQMGRDVRLMVARFPVLQAITKAEVRRWLLEELNATPARAARIASFCRSYWRHLQAIHAVPDDAGPFAELHLRGNGRKGEAQGTWQPFTAEAVVTLWHKARDKGDEQLAELIALGAYTGCRIEELCSLKVENIKDNSLAITDAKTGAGVREVPLHSALRALVHRLCAASSDGYLLSGLGFNKYGDRSNAIGKRFGRLKGEAGFSDRYVFHSIRKTLVTLLENAGVSENVAADIVGHEKPRITYGLYSGGTSMEVKRKALERVRYPAMKLK